MPPSRPHHRRLLLLGAPSFNAVAAKVCSAFDNVDTVKSEQNTWASSQLPTWRILPYKRRPLKLQNELWATETQEASETPLSGSPANTTDSINIPDETTTDLDTSTNLDLDTTISFSASLPLPPLTALTDLEDLPAPSAAILPHSPYTLLVLLLSHTTRTITTRFNRILTLHTLTVGDPTFSPFQISVWTNPAAVTPEERELKAGMRCVGVGDVVVVRRVTMGVFEGRVVGRVAWGGAVEVVVRRGERWRGGGVPGRKVLGVVRWGEGVMGEGTQRREGEWPVETQGEGEGG
ncbi:hypothetical protein EX30DRAFT_373566 [Ascodesmis nigricans]|uniref:Uncharacterized protein n=1 Tax=Ascodesmis nigricans TaxID=341454 RepID=A0A4S2MNK8_9PEZI|nr:hypothetical protein EX30DRAFT_373566 [Ascodesmis nigricans]